MSRYSDRQRARAERAAKRIAEDRARDERDLGWLARREAGETTAQIADSDGFQCGYVRTATNRIRKDSEAAGIGEWNW